MRAGAVPIKAPISDRRARLALEVMVSHGSRESATPLDGRTPASFARAILHELVSGKQERRWDFSRCGSSLVYFVFDRPLTACSASTLTRWYRARQNRVAR